MKKRNVVIGIVISLLLGVSVPLVMDAINNKVNPPSSSEDLPPHIPLDPEFLEKPNDGSKPSDHDIYDNYRIAGGVLSLTDIHLSTVALSTWAADSSKPKRSGLCPSPGRTFCHTPLFSFSVFVLK